MDSERIEATEETTQRFQEPWMREPGEAARLARAEVGPGEGEVERVDDEREDVETWETTDGGESGTNDSWYQRLWSWTRTMSRRSSSPDD